MRLCFLDVRESSIIIIRFAHATKYRKFLEGFSINYKQFKVIRL